MPTLALRRGERVAVVAAAWDDAFAVVTRGRVQLELRDGAPGPVLGRDAGFWLRGTGVRALHNPGRRIATVRIVSRSGSSLHRGVLMPTSTVPTTGLGTALLTGAVVGVIASAANLAISAIARGVLGADDEFVPLTPGPIVMWTMVGAIVGAVGWRLVVNRSTRSRALLSRLVPAVLLLSFVPDALLLASDSTPGQTTSGVVALMVMHVVTAAIAVTAYNRTMPVGGER